MIKNQKINERIFDEIKEISKLDFDFEQECSPVVNVEWFSKQMLLYPSELINTVAITYEYNEEMISSILNELRTDNVCILLVSRDFADQCDKVEPLYKTNYRVEDIPQQWKDQWQNMESNSGMFLPKPNSFITKDLSLKKPDTSLKSKIYPER